ncbi:MAG TPA: hypothetical protein VGR98_14855 [Streptosporangiaceae bacterium]|nr:hypothetical protein [Streptosporangiaceae bacterium]
MRAASAQRGSRAARLGSRRAGRLAVAGLALAGLAAAVAYWESAQPAKPAASSSARYGGLPTWMPRAQVPTGRVVEASEAHPWLAIEGDTVSVHLRRGQVLATAVGPAVPAEGQFPLPSTSPCSFTVTLGRAAGMIPIRPADFTIIDELGRLHHPRVTAPGGGPPPEEAAPGRTVTLIVRDVLPVGSGTLRWSPGTARPVVSWDFDVEID